MSVTPLHYAPALPTSSSSDRVRSVVDLLPVYIELAGRIANTEFVPKDLRRRPEAVLAALMSGAERGLGPMESLRSINVIEGRPSLSAEAMRALVLAAGHEIEIIETTAAKASLVGRRAGSDSTSPAFTWTMDRARRARLSGKDNWVKYPEAMLLARASTDLCRAVFPDVIAGLASTEEVTDQVALAEPVPTSSRRTPTRRPQPAVAPAPAPQITAGPQAGAESGRYAGSSPAPPQPPAAVIDVDEGQAVDDFDEIDQSAPAPSPHDPTLAKRIHAEIAKAFPAANTETRDRWRHALVAVVTRKRPEGPVTSSSDLELEEQIALSDLLVRITGGKVLVADGPDELVEIRAGDWTYTVTLDPPGVIWQRDEPAAGDDVHDETDDD